jgi:hypothetical protein
MASVHKLHNKLTIARLTGLWAIWCTIYDTKNQGGIEMAQQSEQTNSAIKDPQEWKSGDDPATPSQQSYLETLAEQAGEEVQNGELTKAEASEEIDRLRKEAGLE